MEVDDGVLREVSSLANEGGEIDSREAILADVVGGLLRWGSLVGDSFDRVVREVEDRSLLTGRVVSLVSEGEVVKGRVCGLSDEGYLLLEINGVVKSIVEGHSLEFDDVGL